MGSLLDEPWRGESDWIGEYDRLHLQSPLTTLSEGVVLEETLFENQ